MRLPHQSIRVLTSLLLLTWIEAVTLKKEYRCPLGFQLAFTTSGSPICYRQKDPETFADKFKDCTGNLYSSKLYHSLNFTKNKHVLWTEYKSLYPGGPFIDWSYTDTSGDILLSTYDVKYDSSLGIDEELCVVIDPVSNFTAARCDERHYRYCFVNPYSDEDNRETKECTSGSWRFFSPYSTCLTPMTGVAGGAVRATWRQAQELCQRRGAALLNRGWRYSNSPRLHTSGALPYYPMGVIKDPTSDELYYVIGNERTLIPPDEWNFDDSTEVSSDAVFGAIRNDFWRLVNSSFVFLDVVCEHPVPLRDISLNLVLNWENNILLRADNIIKKSDIQCFTDSLIYYPSKVSLSGLNEQVESTFRLKPDLNGYYWCIQRDQRNYHVSQSNKILYIRSKESVQNVYACKIRLRKEYRFQNMEKMNKLWQKKLEEYIYYRTKYVAIFGEPPANDTETALKRFKMERPELDWKDTDVIYGLRLRRLYLDARTALVHVTLSPEMTPPSPGTWDTLEVIFMKPAYFCPGFDSVPSKGLGEHATTVGCRTFTCVGDFNEGVQWVETATEGCTLSPAVARTAVNIGFDDSVMPTLLPIPPRQSEKSPIEDPLPGGDDSSSSDESKKPGPTRPPSTTESTTETEWTITTENNKEPCTEPATTESTSTETPTTEAVPTTAAAPIPIEEQLQQVVEELEQLVVGNDVVSIDSISHPFDQVNEILDVEDSELEIPGELLHLLDKLASRVELSAGQQVMEVRNNVAILMADATPENPVRGVRVAARDYDVFSNTSFGFIDGSLDSGQLLRNVSEAVVYLPASVSSSSRRVSFVAFRNQRAFSSPLRVNSRVFSVNVENITQFENGESVLTQACKEFSSKEEYLAMARDDYHLVWYNIESADELNVILDYKKFASANVTNMECFHNLTEKMMRRYGRKNNKQKENLVMPRSSIFMYLHTKLNIDHVLDEFEVLLRNESVSFACGQVDHLMDQVDTLLDADNDIEIPGNLLQKLDQLGTRLELEQYTGRVVRNNFAFLMADVAPERPFRGLRIEAARNGSFTSDMFHFYNGSTNISVEDTEAFALLPESLMQAHRRISFVAFRTDQAFHQDASCEVNSKVIAVSVENFTGFELGEMIEIYLSPMTREVQRNQSRACAYWHFDDNSTGHWSQEGCTLTISNDDQLDLCRCNHLTHFAQILIMREVFSELDETILEIISVVGCCLSILGIILIGLTAAVFKVWRKNESNKVWLHLCSAVCLLNICFLLTIYVEVDQSDITCTVVGISLHYSVLSTYCWMLVVSILSYRKLVLVFTRNFRYKLLVSSIFSWGFPMLIIGILLAVDPSAYSGRYEEMTPSGHFCYPKDLALWVTVYAPIGLMWFVNWCLYGIIIRSMSESRDVRRHSNSKDNLRPASVSCLLAFICGIPWIFGFFATNIIAAYIFTVTVTFQGFVLFLFFVLGSKKTRDLWLDLFCGKSRGRNTSSSAMNRSRRTTNTPRFNHDNDSSSIPLRDRDYS